MPISSPGRVIHDEMMRAMGRSIKALQRGVKPAPKASGKPQKFKSDKQRRYFFWALNAGKITVPYHREALMVKSLSGTTADSIASVTPIHGGVEGRWGTNIKYAPMVIDKYKQVAYHRGTWWTLQGEAKRLTPKVVKEFQAASVRIADKLGPMWTRTITIEVEL